MSAGQRLGEQIKAYRVGKGLSQKDLAKQCGVGKAQISKVEKDAAVASASTLLRIGHVFGANFAFVDPAAQQLAARISSHGITHCFRDEDEARPSIRKDASRATVIRLLMIRGWGLVGNESSVLRKILEEKGPECSVRALLLKPSSRYVTEINKTVDLIPGTLATAIEATVTALKDLRRTSKANFECRLYDEFPSWRLLFADDTLFLAGYSKFSRDGGAASVHYRVVRKEPPSESLFYPFDLHFDRLWSESEAVR